MEQRNGLSIDFDKGRVFERKETLSFMATVLKLDDPNEMHDLLQAWVIEAAESLELPKKRVVVIEDTYILI